MRVKCNLIKFLGGVNQNKIEPVAKENLKQTKKWTMFGESSQQITPKIDFKKKFTQHRVPK
jgi:hypothetical protein